MTQTINLLFSNDFKKLKDKTKTLFSEVPEVTKTI